MSRFAEVGVLSVVAVICNPSFASEPITVDGRVTAVTVYQGQALVTREVEIPGEQGLVEVVVGNLPEAVLPGSLFAEPGDGVQVRSVRYRTRPVEEDVRQEVRQLDEQIQNVQDGLEAVNRQRAVLAQRINYLTQLEQFSAGTAQQELKSGVLNAETIQKLTEFLFKSRTEVAQQELELNKSHRSRQKELDLLTRKRQTLAASSARTLREAVVFVDCAQAGRIHLRLSYLVGNASWSPSYNLRAGDRREQLVVEYNASVQQMSGEDWNDVAMTLSTAAPSLVAKAPRLEPLAIKLGVLEPPAQSLSAADSYAQVQKQLADLGKQRGTTMLAAPNSAAEAAVRSSLSGEEASTAGRAGGGGGVGGWGFEPNGSTDDDLVLNAAAREWQLLDFNNSLAELRRGGKDSSQQGAEGVSVSYALTNRTSLPSRSDRQLIQIATTPLKGEFYRLATPVLTSYVYEEVKVVNTSEVVFLAGPAATFVGGQFVGRGQMPTVAAGESFTAGLGIDASLRTARELVDKQERIQGGNRVVDFTYQLAVENFGGAAVDVRLLDRLPTAGEDDVKITLVKSDSPVSDDPAHQLADGKKGILRWDVKVEPNASGAKRKTLQYTMQIEYDKQLSILGMPPKS
jgi:hypothetical protein